MVKIKAVVTWGVVCYIQMYLSDASQPAALQLQLELRSVAAFPSISMLRISFSLQLV